MIRKTIAAYREAYSGLPAGVWMLAAVLLITRCGMMVLPFMALYLTAERGLSPSSAGRVVMVWSVAGVLGTYIGGQLCNRVGAIRVLIVCLFLGVPGFIIMPHCPTIASLCVALLYQGIVMEGGRPACQTAATLLCGPEKHAKALAVLRLALNLGFTVGPMVGGVLAKVDYSLLFYVNAAFLLIGAIVGALFFKPWQATPLLADAETQEATTTGPLRDSIFLKYLGLQFVMGLVFFQLLAAMPLTWSNQFRLDEIGVACLFAVNTIVIVMLEMVLIRAINHIAPLRLIAYGSVLVCGGFGMMSIGTSVPYVVVTVLVWTLGEMLYAPYSGTFVAHRSNTRNRASYMAYFSMTFSAANVVAPLLGTWLYEQNPRLPWLCCLPLAILLPTGYLSLQKQCERETADRNSIRPSSEGVTEDVAKEVEATSVAV